MKILMTARHFEPSDALRDHVEQRLGKLTRYDGRLAQLEVTLTEENRVKRVEARAGVQGDKDLHAEATADDFRVAVRDVAEKLARQLKRLHDRRRDHQGPRLGEDIEAEWPVAEGE